MQCFSELITCTKQVSRGIPEGYLNNGGDIIVNNYFNIGNGDNEDLVDEIADIMTRIFTFNNITAGRTV